MLKRIDEKWVGGEFLNYRDDGVVSKGAKTHKFSVITKRTGELVGYIKWFAQWRQYTFHPLNAMFDAKCQREIAEYLDTLTSEQKNKCKIL